MCVCCIICDICTVIFLFQVLSGNIETVQIKEKAKFPQDFFPDVSQISHGLMLF